MVAEGRHVRARDLHGHPISRIDEMMPWSAAALTLSGHAAPVMY